MTQAPQSDPLTSGIPALAVREFPNFLRRVNDASLETVLLLVCVAVCIPTLVVAARCVLSGDGWIVVLVPLGYLGTPLGYWVGHGARRLMDRRRPYAGEILASEGNDYVLPPEPPRQGPRHCSILVIHPDGIIDPDSKLYLPWASFRKCVVSATSSETLTLHCLYAHTWFSNLLACAALILLVAAELSGIVLQYIISFKLLDISILEDGPLLMALSITVWSIWAMFHLSAFKLLHYSNGELDGIRLFVHPIWAVQLPLILQDAHCVDESPIGSLEHVS